MLAGKGEGPLLFAHAQKHALGTKLVQRLRRRKAGGNDAARGMEDASRAREEDPTLKVVVHARVCKVHRGLQRASTGSTEGLVGWGRMWEMSRWPAVTEPAQAVPSAINSPPPAPPARCLLRPNLPFWPLILEHAPPLHAYWRSMRRVPAFSPPPHRIARCGLEGCRPMITLAEIVRAPGRGGQGNCRVRGGSEAAVDRTLHRTLPTCASDLQKDSVFSDRTNSRSSRRTRTIAFSPAGEGRGWCWSRLTLGSGPAGLRRWARI
jgi:hypothetical protein